MSYWNLKDSVKEVQEHWKQTRQLTEDLYNFLREKSIVDLNYSKSLKKLSNSNLFNHSKGTVAAGLSAIQQYCSQSAKHYKSLSKSINEDLVCTLKQLLSHHDFIIKDKAYSAKKLLSSQEKFLREVHKAKSKYWKACQDCDQEPKKPNFVRQEETSLESYLDSLDKYQCFRDTYEKQVKEVLTTYQVHDEERLGLVADVLKKLIVYCASFAKNEEYELRNLPKEVDSFVPEKDIKQFVEQTQSSSFLNVAFEPYTDFLVEENGFRDVLEKCWRGQSLPEEDKASVKLQLTGSLQSEISSEFWQEFVESRVNKYNQAATPRSKAAALWFLKLATQIMLSLDYSQETLVSFCSNLAKNYGLPGSINYLKI